MDPKLAAAEQFASRGRVLSVRAYGRGRIHDTFLVTLGNGEEDHFILQRLNTRVFPRSELVIGNLITCTEHLRRRLAGVDLGPGRRFEVPRVLTTADGADHWLDPRGSCWRGLSLVENAQSFEVIQDLGHARETGYALGLFHALLSDLDPGGLADTLPGFHEIPGYLSHFDQVLAGHQAGLPAAAAHCLRLIGQRRAGAQVLEEAKAQGKLRLRAIHGDPKVNNVMVDRKTHQAVGLVDLDTVKPGLILYDLGDCLRSGCNARGEEDGPGQTVRFDPEICRAILGGYLSQAAGILAENDYAYLYDAIRLLAFELGLRFFTDYLEGNVYFKAQHREENLARALIQFQLMESIESQAQTIRAIIHDLKPH